MKFGGNVLSSKRSHTSFLSPLGFSHPEVQTFCNSVLDPGKLARDF